MEDIVWFELFYQSDPKTAAPFLHGRRAGAAADNLVLQRLQGWSLAEQGKTDKRGSISPRRPTTIHLRRWD